jgi:hypothetical protein
MSAIVGAYLSFMRSIANLFSLSGSLVGALVLFAIVVAFYFLRRRSSAFSKERPLNVLQDDEDISGWHHDLPQYYAAEPFLIPEPTIRGTSEATSTQERPLSMSTADIQGPQTPMTATTTTTRKSAVPHQLRPINIIQHDDAGPRDDLSSHGDPQTIELPPAYTNIRQTRRSPLSASTPTATEDNS